MQSLRPSSAQRWVPCPASPSISEPYYEFEEESEAAREGTAAHEIFECLYRGGTPAAGAAASNGVLVDAEMIECGQLYAEYLPTGARLEQKTDLSEISPGMKGTPDAVFVDEDENTVHIYDYKYGHKPVKARENWQMLSYCAGYMNERPAQFKLHVIQPRCYVEEPIKTWTVSWSDYVGSYLPRLQASAKEALSDSPRAKPGDYCSHCPGRRACQALREAAMTAADMSEQSYARELDATSLGYEMRTLEAAKERLEARLSGLEEQALALLSEGKPVYGYTKQPRYGRAAWTIDPESLFAAADLAGVDLRKPPQPITPNQAIKAGLDENTVKAFTTKPMIGDKLRPVDQEELGSVFGGREE